jgi:hypothetical protein
MIHYLGIPLAKRALKDSLFSPAEQTSFGLFFFLLLFTCAYKAWVISPPCPHPLIIWSLLSFVLFLVMEPGFEVRALHVAGRYSYHFNHALY